MAGGAVARIAVRPGVASLLIFGVEMLELDPCIFGGELPVNVGLFATAGILPGCGFADQGRTSHGTLQQDRVAETARC